jgi:glc operon protein GlcG
MMMKSNKLRVGLAAAVLMAFALTASAQDQLAQKKSITLAIAKKLVAAAETASCKLQCMGSFAVLDEGGNLIYLERMENTENSSSDLVVKKARSAYLWRRPTQFFADSLLKGGTFYLSLPNIVAAGGGIPLKVDGKIVGAFACAGSGRGTDSAITKAVAEALAKLVGN